ncbi:DUF922 domain-containing protein [Ulvibacter antarcticus]|uniref:Secreted Zn-dependent protease n=1 Tax=Ulvibacter antarcticus TaxID=442714 RepID=A0A3L9YGG1_9FLAO|nr:DUF922 domain-containing protein [Ulvibacter antarcticus]RMA58520.1 hypothetical protein BXY75_1893 [Ulvibacter antarcticus]
MKILSIILLILFSYPSESDPEKINWSNSRKLSWADFKGVPNKGADFVASTNSGISFSYSFKYKNDDITYDFSVESFFYPKESWYKRGLVSPYILKHEQAHFDISELHARKLRRLISEATFTKNIKKEIEPLYRKVEEDRREMQNKFDAESEHSKNEEMEYQWEAYIAKQLKAYEHWR